MIRMPPALGILLLVVGILATRYGVDTYNESRLVEKEKCYPGYNGTSHCFKEKVEAPGHLPSVVAVGLPYVVFAAIGYYLLGLPPFAVGLALAGSAVLYLGFGRNPW